MNGLVPRDGRSRRRIVVLLALVIATVAVACGKTTRETTQASTLECKPPQMLCSGQCVDIASDTSNCGGCGQPCSNDDSCNGGVCSSTGCGPGRTKCGGMCVDLEQNDLNCGSCNTACTDNRTCFGGVCRCVAPARECNGACTDVSSSRQHCGECGRACAVDEVCTSGSCTPLCQPPLSFCDGRCVDLTSDATACGSCGKACAGSEACVNSQCTCPNAPEYTPCNGVCTSTMTSPQHCGGCNRPCPTGQLCQGGACTACSGDYFYCPTPGSDARETCLAQARERADASAGPDLACQCNHCLAELEDCAKDEACKITWQCAVKNACQAPCWGAMGVCPLGTPGGCFKWCPPGTPTAQTGARVEALLRCTIDKGCN